MDLEQALSQIADIRHQMTRTRIFRGFRATTTLGTGIVAILAAFWQAWEIPDPASHPLRFVELWTGLAVACMALVGIELFLRHRDSDSSLQRDLTLPTVGQFLPAIVAGALVTAVLCLFAPANLWLLPGLWQMFYGLAIIASRRLLPGWCGAVGAFYILGGVVDLATAASGSPFSPWSMGIPFGVGQASAALVLRQRGGF